MSRHVADHAAEHPSGSGAGPRLREFLRIARAEGLHPAVRALHARRPAAAATAAGGRLRPYLRIERGRTA